MVVRYYSSIHSLNQGGLPAWLLSKKDIVLRSSDPGENQRKAGWLVTWSHPVSTCNAASFAFVYVRLHRRCGPVDGEAAAHDEAVPLPEWWSYHHRAGEKGILVLAVCVGCCASLKNVTPSLATPISGRWRTNMAATSPATTTTCVT